MDRDSFWAVIEAARSSNQGFLAHMATYLDGLSAAEFMAFERAFTWRMWESYSYDLWGAAYLINYGCSDDCFCYFQHWLISKGREIFEAAVADPDLLSEVVENHLIGEVYDCTDLMNLISEVAMNKPGVDEESPVIPGLTWDAKCTGFEDPDFDDRDWMQTRYPQLCKMFW